MEDLTLFTAAQSIVAQLNTPVVRIGFDVLDGAGCITPTAGQVLGNYAMIIFKLADKIVNEQKNPAREIRKLKAKITQEFSAVPTPANPEHNLVKTVDTQPIGSTVNVFHWRNRISQVKSRRPRSYGAHLGSRTLRKSNIARGQGRYSGRKS